MEYFPLLSPYFNDPPCFDDSHWFDCLFAIIVFVVFQKGIPEHTILFPLFIQLLKLSVQGDQIFLDDIFDTIFQLQQSIIVSGNSSRAPSVSVWVVVVLHLDRILLFEGTLMIRVEQYLLEDSSCTFDQVVGSSQDQVGGQEKPSTNATYFFIVFLDFHVESSYVPA